MSSYEKALKGAEKKIRRVEQDEEKEEREEKHDEKILKKAGREIKKCEHKCAKHK